MSYDLNFVLHSRHQGTVKKCFSCERIINYFLGVKLVDCTVYLSFWPDGCGGWWDTQDLFVRILLSVITNDTICTDQGKRAQRESPKPNGNSVAVFHQQILLLDTKSRLHLPEAAMALITWIIFIFHPDTHNAKRMHSTFCFWLSRRRGMVVDYCFCVAVEYKY